MPIEIFIILLIIIFLILAFIIEQLVDKASEKVWDDKDQNFVKRDINGNLKRIK